MEDQILQKMAMGISRMTKSAKKGKCMHGRQTNVRQSRSLSI